MSVGDAIRLLDLKPQYQQLLRSDPALWDKAVSDALREGIPSNATDAAKVLEDAIRRQVDGQPLRLGVQGHGPAAGCEDVPVLTDTATTQAVLDVVGVFVFALSGAVVAVRRGLDLFGVLVLAWVAGLGAASSATCSSASPHRSRSSDWQLLAAAVAAAVLVFLLHGRWEELADPHARRALAPAAVRRAPARRRRARPLRGQRGARRARARVPARSPPR